MGQLKRTFNMRKRTENATWTVSSNLYVIALGRLVDLRMELLLRTSVTVLAVVAGFAVGRFAPFLAMLHIRTWC